MKITESNTKEKTNINDKSFLNKINQHADFSILPCEGIYKLSSTNDGVTYSYCDSDYWHCPNKKCIMQLV
ncbi:MAG: hypothetical protein OEZ22_08595 [Spirochaetia bacterium]|nr:hypothetical protein [Spirochaetia bacterium]